MRKATSGSACTRARLASVVPSAYALAGVLLASFVLAADAQQEPRLTLDVSPKAITLGESVYASFTIQGVGNADPPVLPDIPDLRVDRNPSRSYNTSIVNMNVTRTDTYRYRLTPLREGRFTIGPFEYELAGRIVTIPAQQFDVAPRPASGAAGGLEQNLMARIEPERTRIYMQEAVPITLSIYSRGISLGSNLGLDGLPSSGLEFESFQEVRGEPEIINNQVYEVRRFRSVVRPLTAGTFVIKPDLRVPVRVERGRNRARSPFDLFASMSVNVENVMVYPEPVEIEVLPLPEQDRPVSFSGAVGEFAFDVTSAPDRIQVGDPITLTMSISGRGNMDAVSAPDLDFGPHFKVYEPKLTASKLSEDRTAGSKTFEQVIIPKQDGIDAVPPIQFSFFAPRESAYHTLDRGPFPIEILPRSNAAARVIQAAPSTDAAVELRVLEQDIVYLKPAPDRWRRSDRRPWYRHPLFLSAQVVPPLVAFVLFATTRRRRQLTIDVARARRLRAPRKARSGIERAYAALEQADNRLFFEAVWDAMCLYFGDRMNLSPGEVSVEAVAGPFAAAGMKVEDVEQLRMLFDLCEQIRFGHGWADQKVMDETNLRSAQIVLEKLERVIRECERVRW